MKKLFPLLLAVMAVCVIRLQAQTVGIDPFGYGAGVTGGGSATPTLVSNLSELKTALSSKPTNKVIIITKDITVDGVIQVKDGANLTLMALPGVKIIATNWDVELADKNKLTGIFEFTRIDNLIIRNLTLEGPGAYDCDGRDHITLQDVTNAWIDHCDFSDAVDDCMDIKNTSDNITVSWCHFHYDKAYHPNGPGDASGDKDHRFVSLLGSSSSDKPSDGTYNVTYAYLWFDEGCMQRMIRCRNADLHFLGCYWNSSKASYYIGPENVSAYIELCTFEGGPKAENIYKAYNSTKNPVKFVNTVSAKGLPSDYGTVSAPTYSYAKYATAAEAKTAVTDPNCGAGATLIVETDGTVSSGCSISRVQHTITFNANGGSGSMDAQEGYEGANTTLNPCTFTAPTGKAFAGWNTAANGNGTAYTDQSVIVLTENTTLYAQWAQAYTVTYNNNGHGTAPDAVTVGSGAVLTEPVAPSESGWVFGGWYTEQTCENAWDFATMTVTQDLTLYAKWTEKTCEEQVWYNTQPTGVAQATCFTFATTPTGSSSCDVTMTIDGTEYHAEKRSSDWNSTFTFTVPDGQTGTLYVCAKSSGSTRTVTIADGGGTLAVEGTTIKTYASQTLNAGTYTVSTNGNIHIAMLALQLCGSSQVSDEKTYYDVTFNSNGHGTAPATQSIIENGLVSEPVAPSESGWVFGGWYKEQTCVTPWSFEKDLVTAATTLYAKWTEAVSNGCAEGEWAVTFDCNGRGISPEKQCIANGMFAAQPEMSSVDGYIVKGWYTNAACDGVAWNFEEDPITADKTLYAWWVADLNSGWSLTGELEGEFVKNIGDASSTAYLTIRLNANTTYEFNLQGANTFTYGSLISGTSTVTFAEGTAVASIKAGVAGDYEFILDYSNVSAPQLTVNYPAAVTVTFDANGHGTAPASQTIAANSVAKEPTALSETGWTFGGWYTEAACTNAWNFSTLVSCDTTLYAKWTEAVASADICWSWSTADTIRATTTMDGLTIVANSTGTVTIDANKKTIDGTNFTHRLKLGGSGNASYRHLYFAVTGPCAIDIYAQSSSSSADRSLTVHSGSFTGTKIGTASAPGAAPAKSTITYTGGAGNIYVYSPSSGVNIYGICVRYGATTEYTITYELNGHGDAIASAIGTALPNPLPTPSASGWIFDGWYTDAVFNIAAVAGASITSNTTLYAKWTEQTSSVGYTISYNMNGHGAAISSVSNATTLPNPLPTPSASGYTFDGWYTDAGLSSAAVAGASIDADITLYAKWTASSDPVTPSTGEKEGGWFEACWMEFDLNGYSSFVGYISADGGATWTKLDAELVRSYGTYGRVDAVGLKAGNYLLKVVPVTGGIEQCAGAIVSGNLVVKAHDRHGFAHTGTYASEGIGAYNNDGTLKSGARVLYVTAATAKTVSLSMQTSSSAETTCTGLQAIIAAYEKGYESRPLAIRILGTITADDMDYFGSSAEGLQVKGKGYTTINLTLEGIGKDAAIHGFGILGRGISSAEFRNFAILNCMDDCLGLDTKNSYVWIHHLDFFYGQAGSAADQAKGDGTVDLKGDSKWITISYNHFFDSGKMSLCGMKSETGPNYITYHHNWFDHSDSRHPRIRTMSVHIFNNYFDGNAKYGVGVTMGSSAFVECNYYRACSKPMMSSMQGTDALGEGTFSGEDGGIIKAYNNHFATTVSYITYQQNATSFDAYEVSNRTEKVPSNVVTLQGGTTYDNFDTEYAEMYAVTPDDPLLVPDMVTGTYGAGRLQHGDIEYTFSEADDSSYAVNTALKSLVVNYTSSWSGTIIGTTTATECEDIVEGHILLAEVSPAGYGTLSRSSILGIADNTAISASGNVLTVGETAITATPATATAEYTYAFDQWAWTPEGSTITANVTATASFTRTANSYTLTWDVNGGDALSGTYTQGTVAYGTTIVQPNTPTREGYTFLGWSPLPAATMPAANMTYVAQWKDNSVVGYTITYNMNGHGEQIASVAEATALPASLPAPTAEGYTFVGWFTDAGLTTAAVVGATLDADITLYAKWTATSSGGTGSGYEWYVDSVTHKGNNDFYTVSGNYSKDKGTVTYNGKKYTECLKMESSTRITFTLTEKVTMTFVFDVASKKFNVDGTSYTTDANGVCTVELAVGAHTITKGDAINLFYINAVGSAPATYTATIGVTPAAYGSIDVSRIADIASGTAIAISGNTLTIGSTAVTATPAAATAEYTYSFDSWTINPNGTTVTSDITITANFTCTANTYTLTWDANGGVLTGEYTQGTVAYGAAIVQPADPTREGYTFLGWDVTPAATMPAANTTYTAQWEAVVLTETTFHTAGNWSVASNWTNGLPSASLIANIEANCVVDISTAVAKQVRLKSGNTLTVASTGGLQIAEDIKRQDGTTLQAGDLTIQSNSSAQGAIVIGTEDGTTPATVEFYSKAYKDAHTHYQYIGIPFSNVPLATAFFTGSIVYTYAESSGWVKATTSTTLQAFTGYCLSQTAAKTYTMQGQLCASATKSIPLTYSAQNGANLVGNSWMAPLQINNFEDADFPVGAEKTIFIYNTGSVDEYNSNNGSSSFGSKPGQYFSIPIHAAPYADGLPTAIPPMQAFQVNTTQNGNLTLDYARLTGSATGLSTAPLRAPQQHQAEQEAPVVLRIAVSGNEGTTSSDQVYLMQRADFTEDFDNGWDGTKMQGDANLLSLYTADNKAIDARPNLIGTQLIFRAGEEQEYTLAYEYNGSEAIYLYDAKTNRYSPISDGSTYAFSSTAAEVSARFRIASAEEALQTPTGTEQTCMQDGILYNPLGQEMHIRLFDARGCLIMQTTTTEAIYRVEGYGNGVYIMEVTTNTQRQLQKLILSDK